MVAERIRIISRLIKRTYAKNRYETMGLLFRRYPGFILGSRCEHPTEIPAFVFHEVSTDSFAPMLQFLVDNQYATLTADEYVERRLTKERNQTREVLLSFDDGHKSLYKVAFPALKQFGLKAVAYIVPGMIPENGSSANGIEPVCNWNEIVEMHESGTVDFQSHSMYHHSIANSDRLVDFVRPCMLPFLFDDFVPFVSAEGRVKELYELEYGTPILEWAPRFSTARAFRESPGTVLACVEHVKRCGGVDFFQKTNWRNQLKAVMTDARNRNQNTGYETDSEQRQAIKDDLLNSRQMIESLLPGKKVEHFCYPWFHGSALSAEISSEVGYISNAWGSALPDYAFRDRELIPIARLNPLYIWRLPGKGRKTLSEVLRLKYSTAIARRVKGIGTSFSKPRSEKGDQK
jgi:hypothetical protein